MFKFRRDDTLSQHKYLDADSYYKDLVDSFKRKADHNKIESQLTYVTTIVCTLLAPMFVTLADGLILGKIIPAILSLLAAASTSWLQLRKPDRLWAIYRRTQRELEQEKILYDFKIGSYENDVSREKNFIKRSSEISFEAHCKWEGIHPGHSEAPLEVNKSKESGQS